jgi:hypothetical protein
MDSSFYNAAGNNIATTVNIIAVALIVFVPLGLWKLIEIGIWCYSHLAISIGIR